MSDKPLNVSARAREAAADAYRKLNFSPSFVGRVRRGQEGGRLTQAFATFERDLLEDVKGLREALAFAVGALREVGDDYPGSSCQKWCQQKANEATMMAAGKIEIPFAHCCAEGGGRIEGCDCVNKDHGTAWVDAPRAALTKDAPHVR